jgi:2-dehydro-3-deoxy-L-rhamnonate dehydrogenase (NAD+)
MTTTRTALVTGGASGLGAASAKRLRADGLKVLTLDLRAADVCVDVTDTDALWRAAAQTASPQRVTKPSLAHSTGR